MNTQTRPTRYSNRPAAVSSLGLVTLLLLGSTDPARASVAGDPDVRFNPTGTPGALHYGSAAAHEEIMGMASAGNATYVAHQANPIAPGDSYVVINKFGPDGTKDLTFGTAGDYFPAAIPDQGLWGAAFGGLTLGIEGPIIAYSSFGDIYVEALSDDGVLIAGNSAAWDLKTNGNDVVLDVAACGSKVAVVGTAETAAAEDAAIAVFELVTPEGGPSTFNLDTSFNASGKYTVGFNSPNPTFDVFESVVCQGTSYVAAGSSGTDIFDSAGVIARFTSAGDLDSTFDGDGIATYQASISVDARSETIVFTTAFRDVTISEANELFVVTGGQLSAVFIGKISNTGALVSGFGDQGWAGQELGADIDGIPATIFPSEILLVDHQTVVALGGAEAQEFVRGPLSVRHGFGYVAVDRSTGAPDANWQGTRAIESSAEWISVGAGVLRPDGTVLLGAGYGNVPIQDRQIIVQALFAGLFFDGFESNDLSAWAP